MAFVLKRN